MLLQYRQKIHQGRIGIVRHIRTHQLGRNIVCIQQGQILQGIGAQACQGSGTSMSANPSFHWDDHLDGPPLIVTRTEGATPFRLVTHIGDVGHTLVAGPTGMGKSVLLATLAMQFRRYRGSRIFAFDMGRSMRATILGLGGEHYDLGTDGEIAFQPLARIDREGYRTWAAEWLEGRLRHEGVAVGPDEKVAIWSALGSLAGAPLEQRTMTGLSVLLQSNALRQALAPYVLGGAHGKLLDADADRLGSGGVQCFEMEELMHSKAAVLAVLGYLFARFDERFDGAPTLLILDESWLFLDDPVFAARIRQWLKTLRKRKGSLKTTVEVRVTMDGL